MFVVARKVECGNRSVLSRVGPMRSGFARVRPRERPQCPDGATLVSRSETLDSSIENPSSHPTQHTLYASRDTSHETPPPLGLAPATPFLRPTATLPCRCRIAHAPLTSATMSSPTAPNRSITPALTDA
eukprot:3604852-Prymnesium_polylepis.1